MNLQFTPVLEAINHDSFSEYHLFPGNGYTALDLYGSVHQVSDRFNTNERVIIRHPSKGTYVCVVTLERQLISGASFSVVITGGFSQLPVSEVCNRCCSRSASFIIMFYF
jgi:hypothetical protein